MVNSIHQVLAVLLLCDIAFSQQLLPQNLTWHNLPEDANLNFVELAEKYGHPAREYQVITEDGYILTMHHIPGKRGPVLLQHGFLDSSDTFIIRGNTSMAITLAEEGYDLWFGNMRGNKYSRQHVFLNPDFDKQYWHFSAHEMGYYDLTTMIDFVLEKTNTTKLSAIGHSEGTTIFFVMGASRPEYNEKISVFLALGPAAFLTHMKPPLKIAVDYSPEINDAFISVGIEELINDKSTLKQLLVWLCTKLSGGDELCSEGISLLGGGSEPEELEQEFAYIFGPHYFAGTSRMNFMHLAQISRENRFQNYDFGPEKNLEIYGSEIPPEYDLKKVTMMVELFVGKKDKLATVEDVNALTNILPNNNYTLLNIGHFDFVWGKHMNQYLFPLVKQVLKEKNE